MTNPGASAPRPDLRPVNPCFSSGPCAKRPGFTLFALSDAMLGRSHRAPAPKARLAEVIDRGLGSKLRVRIDPISLELSKRGGSLSASISFQREREAGQDGDVATGEVVLDFSTSIAPERLAEANLTVAEPVIACMQERGPATTGLCRDVVALPYVDETGVVSP